ncbi:GPW/gp25 family protein [Runella sp.]|uniref:GPW/gp25 family protein n=1 Tax=Runella sp. TaxID=1960881 RepID=UPI0026095407|nr:GPW/gp25 family protein [Runella sp.]
MPDDYYPVPPSFGSLMKRQSTEKISVEESIAQNISLYLSSKPKEYHFDHTYGCIVHGYDFRQLRDTPSKDQIKRSIEEYLRKFETRITVQKVSIEITDVEEKVDGASPRICRYIQIVISSTLVQTQEKLRDMKFRLVRYS